MVRTVGFVDDIDANNNNSNERMNGGSNRGSRTRASASAGSGKTFAHANISSNNNNNNSSNDYDGMTFRERLRQLHQHHQFQNEESTPLMGRGGSNHSHDKQKNNDNTNYSDSSNNNNNKGSVHERRRTLKERVISYAAIAASVLALVLGAFCLTDFVFGWGNGRRVIHGNKHRQSIPGSEPGSSGTVNPHKGAPNHGMDGSNMYDELGRYMLDDYDAQPPFSDFLPALAGYYGKPLYAFYVNRGQGIASFGFKTKDFPIMEFNPANKAYQNVAQLGFRTFIQGSRKGQADFLIEPFNPLQTRHEQLLYASSSQATTSFAYSSTTSENTIASTIRAATAGLGGSGSSAGSAAAAAANNKNFGKLPQRRMYVGSNELQVQETDRVHNIETNVTYFTMPEEDFGAFVRRITITNIDSSSTLTLSLLDGLAKIEPAGGALDKLLKNMGRTLQGWMGVYSPYDDTLQMPFYRLSTEPTDSAAVVVQEAGHWVLSVLEKGNNVDLLPIVYDTSAIFGEDTTLLRPVQLLGKRIRDIVAGKQYGAARTSSAFAALSDYTLKSGQSLTITTYFGRAGHVLDVPVIARRLLQEGFAQYKLSRSREIIKQITAAVETNTASDLWDGHVQQMMLDNSLRGGIPAILGEVDDDARMRNADEDYRLKVYHLFSRIHGDLERDYNDFDIPPTFFSQGPGNFRDVAQNRRNDVIFNPRIGAFNINSFLSLIQADGYNPLTVEAVVFVISSLKTCERLATRAVGEADGHRAQREALTGILNSGPFRPGQLFLLMEQQNIELMMARQDFIDMVAAAADYNPMAVYKTGFWADHWTYYMDIIQTYLSIYPDWEERIMFDERLPYFFSPGFVKPRSEKYVLSVSFDGHGHHVRQLDATVEDPDEVKYQSQYIRNETGWYDYGANWQHDESGRVFKSSPIAKLFLLATIKFATRDPYGMGIEYEAGRPGWDDANNGLVGMIGSGMPETYELYVLLKYIISMTRTGRPFVVLTELGDLLDAINDALDVLAEKEGEESIYDLNATVPNYLFKYWDAVASARETYRERTKTTFLGTVTEFSADDVSKMLQRWLGEINRGILRALEFGSHGDDDDGSTGLTPTYFSYNVTKWKETGERNKDGHPLVNPKEMMVSLFPLFLEGPMRMMKMVPNNEAARDIYKAVKASPLRDEGLGMYTISASLKGQSFDMGREMAFASGWLENQSVWLHMSYKFYLELIRHDLFDEFYEEMTSGGMLPFMDPKVYGRSLMECSSFIASSAFEDPSVRGRGFLARLSGSTAEFLSMWVLMFIGPKPYFYYEGQLRMQLLPALPRWMFQDPSTKNSGTVQAAPFVSFKLFGSIHVTYYHNRGEENLYRVPPSRYIIGLRDGSTFNVDGPSIPVSLADKIRRVALVASIDAYFD